MVDLDAIAVPAFSIAVLGRTTFRYTGTNAANSQLTGLTTAELCGKTPEEIHGETVGAKLRERYLACVEKRTTVSYEADALLPSGHTWWRTTLIPVFGPEGEVDELFGICENLTGKRKFEREIASANVHLDYALRCLKGAEWRYFPNSGQYETSPNLAIVMGETAPRPVEWDEWMNRIFPQDKDGSGCQILLDGLSQEQVVRFRFRGQSGDVRWAQCRRILDTKDELSPVIYGLVSDVTAEVEREMRLERIANRDVLTGLLNRRGIRHELGLAFAKHDATSLAVLMIDLDDFKGINDRHGHAIGDKVLIEVGHRLTDRCGPAALVGRLGGDEFIVALLGIDGETAGAAQVAVDGALRQDCTIDGIAIDLRGSVGLAFSASCSDHRELLTAADANSYEVKKLHKMEQIGSTLRTADPAGAGLGLKH